MAARLPRALLNTQQVVDLDDGEDADLEMDDCFFPGSDDELGFEEVELEEEDTVDGDGNNSNPEDSDIDDSESSDVSAENIAWTENLTPITVKAFEKTPGPKVPIPRSAKEIFFLFFTSTLLELIVEQTNQYAAECMGQERFEKWNNVTVDELCAYMGFMLLMGIVHLPSLYDYWKNDEVYHYSPIADKISRNRFHELHRYLHFVDNSTISPPGSPDYDRLGKVRPVADILSDRVAAVYEPGRDININEAMIPFKGRSTLKQYMPLKPVPYSSTVTNLEQGRPRYFTVYR